MDAITAVSGSGPAYVFAFAEALLRAAETLGFSREEAMLLVGQTGVGSWAYLMQSGFAASRLRDQVTSPGGTTAAALQVLTDGGFLRHAGPGPAGCGTPRQGTGSARLKVRYRSAASSAAAGGRQRGRNPGAFARASPLSHTLAVPPPRQPTNPLRRMKPVQAPHVQLGVRMVNEASAVLLLRLLSNPFWVDSWMV
jgi:hypothetical protein